VGTAADLTTTSQTRLIAIKLMRVSGNPQIEGTSWLDFTVKCTESATDLALGLP